MSSWRDGENLSRGEEPRLDFRFLHYKEKKWVWWIPPGLQFIMKNTKEMMERYCVIPDWLI